MCWPNGNSDIQEGENQSKKSDSVEEKAMLSSTTMGQVHPTQHVTSQQTRVFNDFAVRTQVLYLLY